MPGPKPTPGAKEAREARHRAACRNRYRSNKPKQRAERNDRDARKLQIEKRLRPAPETGSAFTIVNHHELNRPDLLWLDTNGTLHREDRRSAVQLIADWKKGNA
jgi:hypothetical protein